MNQSAFTLIQNTALTASVHELKLRGDCSAITAPGQFVQVSLPGKFLRRPFSVCDRTEDTLTLCDRGKVVTAALCFRTAADVYYVNQFEAIDAQVVVYTEDGSLGERGSALDALELTHSQLFACGPLGMLEALDVNEELDAQLSLEARMGCGFGACMGCTIETADGPKRVCADGPVFPGGVITW